MTLRRRSSQQITVPLAGPPIAIGLVALDLPGAPPTAEAAGAPLDPQALLDRIEVLERRLSEVESTTVLSEPETRVRQKDVYVDANGNQFDVPTPGTTKTTTYQRERVYRRQTISEKIDEALADAEEHSVKLGVSAAIVPQTARQNKGEETEADGHAYQLASADFFFTAGIAQNTIFYADIVGLSGTPPDLELNGLTLVNGYSARLDTQNAINLREAWLRTEIFNQKLALVGGRLDLTNFFDRNAAANDETSQFLSDALVNNPTLGLATNGSGFATILDPKNGLTLKFGFQQSNPQATSLSESLYTLYGPVPSRFPRSGRGRTGAGIDTRTCRAWGAMPGGSASTRRSAQRSRCLDVTATATCPPALKLTSQPTSARTSGAPASRWPTARCSTPSTAGVSDMPKPISTLAIRNSCSKGITISNCQRSSGCRSI